MRIQLLKKLPAFLCGLLLATNALFAVTIDTKNGSRVTGKVTQIDANAVIINTGFAGDIKIKQGEIASITTDGPVNVRLADGRVMRGSITNAGPGSVAITGPGDAVTAGFNQLREIWALDAKDPELVRHEHKWSFETGMSMTGKTGNKDQTGTSFSFRATLKSSSDTLQLYTGYDRQVTDHEKSADQFRAGADYQNNFYARLSWYARDEYGFDRVKDIHTQNTAAAGLGIDFIKCKIDTLTFRGGLSHRYVNYYNLVADDLRDMGLDFGLNNQLTTKNWSMVNRISYTPSFENFSIFRIHHESYVELPLARPRWKLRIGMSNDYNSKPAPGTERLDTTYFARLVLTWK